MDNAFEEIHAIWSQQLLEHGKNVLSDEIVKDHVGIFMPNAVEWRIQIIGHWCIETQFDPINHEVYQIDVTTLGNGIARYRWVNPKYSKQYHKNNFEYQMDDKHVKEIYQEYTPLKILDVARDAVEGITYNNDGTVNIPLDITDEEFLTIARAAHTLDITINEYMVRAVEEQLYKSHNETRL